MPQGNQQTQQNFELRQVTSSTALHWMNNTPVPMDTSNQAHAPTWCTRPSQGNMAQVEPNQTANRPPRKCYNCDKVGHLVAQCRAPKKARITCAYDEPEDTTNLTPDNILDNALSSFDRLSNDLKDEFIQKYEGE